jgi:putative aldouronate transport system permease protein
MDIPVKPFVKTKPVKRRVNSLPYHIMMMPALILLIIFKVIPIAGIAMAFERYNPAAAWFGLASKWTGLQNFRTIFLMHPDSRQVIINTLIIAVSKIVLHLVIPVIFALLLCECRISWLKRGIQTIVYLPHFLSWVIAGVMFRQIFSNTGIANTVLINLGLIPEPIMFMASNTYFRPIVILTDVVKGFGYSAVVYIAAITSIDLSLYEAADIDGASRWGKMRFVTFPGILPTIVLMMTLALGNVLNAGSDQILNMYNPVVYRTGDILDTFVYRTGLQNMQFHLATAVGLAKSVISMILIIFSYKLADKFAGYRIF